MRSGRVLVRPVGDVVVMAGHETPERPVISEAVLKLLNDMLFRLVECALELSSLQGAVCFASISGLSSEL